MKNITKQVSVFILALSLFVFTANAQYTTIVNFNGAANGANPQGSLISDGTWLYGMARYGGANNMGEVFRVMPNGIHSILFGHFQVQTELTHMARLFMMEHIYTE